MRDTKTLFIVICIYTCVCLYPLSYNKHQNPVYSVRHVHVMINVLKRPIQKQKRKKTNGKNCLDGPFHADALINRHRVFREGSTKNEGYK